MAPDEIEELADAIHVRMAKAILSLPAEFKELTLKNFILPPLQIPIESRNDMYFRLDIRITSSGSMVFRILDMNGMMYKEWVME
jgi:hypothetical protein